MENPKYRQLVEHLLETGELGHYDPEKYSICLYGIENKPHILEDIQKRVNKITTKHKFIVLDPKDKYTNINILDIEL